jgi:ATP-binding cassette subfamily B protein
VSTDGGARRIRSTTLLGKEFGGTDLSGGQRQRLAIARGVIRGNAKVILLDEPTAALDPLKEAKVLEDFARIVQNRTGLVITHRLGFVSRAQQIVVMESGRIVEQGPTAEIVRSGTRFAGMKHAQEHMWSLG